MAEKAHCQGYPPQELRIGLWDLESLINNDVHANDNHKGMAEFFCLHAAAVHKRKLWKDQAVPLQKVSPEQPRV